MLILPTIRTSNDPVKTYQDQKFWAEGGMIKMVNERDGQVKDLTISQFLERGRAFGRLLAKYRDPRPRAAIVQLLEDMRDVIERAKAQGDPTDQAVVLEKARHRGHAQVLSTGYHDFNDGVSEVRVGAPTPAEAV